MGTFYFLAYFVMSAQAGFNPVGPAYLGCTPPVVYIFIVTIGHLHLEVDAFV